MYNIKESEDNMNKCFYEYNSKDNDCPRLQLQQANERIEELEKVLKEIKDICNFPGVRLCAYDDEVDTCDYEITIYNILRLIEERYQ